jgi:predicted MFS family arabinose efflux permease
MIILTLFIWSAVTWLTAWAKTFEQLLAMRALVGVCEACYLPAALALISEYHRGPTRSLATGLHLTGMVSGSAIGGLGGWVAQHHGWSAAFSVVGVAGIIYCAPLLLLLRDAPGEALGEAAKPVTAPKVRFGRALANLFGHSSYILAIIYWGVLGATSWGLTGWTPVYLQEHFHLSQGTAGFDTHIYGSVAGLAGMLGGGVWADRWSRSNIRGRVFVPVVGLCVATPGLLLMAHTNILALALVGTASFAVANGFANCNMMPILCLITDPRYRATGYGVLNMCGTVAGGLAVYVTGVLRDLHVSLAKILTWSTGDLLLCAALLLLLKTQPKPAGS